MNYNFPVNNDFDISNLTRESLDAEIHYIRKAREDAKTNILKGKLLDLGINIDFDKEEKSLHKPLVCEYSNNKETWYYKNGSSKMIRIVTFYNDILGNVTDHNGCELITTIKYK